MTMTRMQDVLFFVTILLLLYLGTCALWYYHARKGK